MKSVLIGKENAGEIDNMFHGAGNLLMEFDNKSCCGGDHLIHALREKEVEISEADWRNLSMISLINQVMLGHHLFLRTELPLLGELIKKIMRLHGNKHKELIELYRLFCYLKNELEQHLFDEEELFFPFIIKYEKTNSIDALKQAKPFIDKLESDHDLVSKILKQIRLLTSNFTLPGDTCRTFALTFIMLNKLESNMEDHIHLENNFLFPRIRSS